MRQGWECPKCGRMYAPFIHECGKCNAKKDPPSMWAPQQPHVECEKCAVCGGTGFVPDYHNVRCPHGCPGPTVTM